MNASIPTLRVLLVAFLLGVGPQALAVPPRRYDHGQVLSVDVPAQQLVIKFDSKSRGTRTYVWARRTVAWVRGARSDLSAIKPGDRVKAVCVIPIFGKPFVARIVVPQDSP